MRSSLVVLSLTLGWVLAPPQDADAQSAGCSPTYCEPALCASTVSDKCGPGSESSCSTPYCSYLGDLGDGSDCKEGAQCGVACDCLGCRRDIYWRRAFGSVEFLQWWNKGRHLPPLVTTSVPGTPPAQAGVLDPGGVPSATTSILVGDEAIGGGLQAGGRVTFGTWLDDCESVAIGARLFGVEGDNRGYSRQSNGSTILAVPFYDSNPLVNAENALIYSYPNLSEGSADVWAENEVFGAQAFLRYMIDAGPNYRLDMVTGYRFTRVNDDVQFDVFASDGVADFNFHDLFRTRNAFHAGEVGLIGEYQVSRWTLGATGTISFGTMEQRVGIAGENTVTAGGISVTTPGGIFAQPTNINEYKRNVSVLAPEAGVKLSYAMTERLSVSVGYTFLYWTRMALAGDQIDRDVNSTQLRGGVLAGPAQPQFRWRDTDFWVQSIDIGVSVNY